MPYSVRNKVEFNVFQLLTMCVFDCFLLLNRNYFHDEIQDEILVSFMISDKIICTIRPTYLSMKE